MIAQPVEDDARDETTNLAGIPYQHEWIEADRLEWDPAYQYFVLTSVVNRIATEFDPFLLDDLLVNRRDDGRMMVMDGKHRVLAVRKMGWGDQKMPCAVYDKLPIELEAKRFNVQIARRRLKPQEEFRAALLAGDPEAHEIEALVHKHGYVLNLSDSDLSGGKIVAVAALRKILRKRRRGILDIVLALAHEGFGTDHGPRHLLLDGLAVFVSRFGEEYDRRRVVEVMRRTSLNKVSADGVDAARVLGVATSEGVAFALWKHYNYRLSDDRKLPDFSGTGQRKRLASA